VIGEAMAAKEMVGIGRITVRAAEFSAKAKGEADADMVAVAETIIGRRRAKFDPAAFGDRYQDALRELVDGKLKGVAQAPSEVGEPSKVINLMDALKRSLAQEAAGAEASGDSGDVARSFRDHVARCSDMMSPA
jgi:non-homologous end joining protein Ku